jgi:phosphatidate cytidylyltransferase
VDADNPDTESTRSDDIDEENPWPRPAQKRPEGVRIIGADEDAPRYGDVPEMPPPPGSPPAARFPLPGAVDPAEVRPAAQLPHWTDPPTGEVPAVLGGGAGSGGSTGGGEAGDDLAWSGLTSGTARWRDQPRDWDDAGFEHLEELTELAPEEQLMVQGVLGDDEVFSTGAPPPRRVSSRIETGSRGAGPAGRGSTASRVATGLAIGIVALVMFKAGPIPSLALVTLVATGASAEVFGVLRRAGFRPATLLGLAATVSVMVGAYVKGETALPLVATLTTVFSVVWYLAGVVPARTTRNVGATLLGFMWVGFLASYAGLLLDPNAFPHRHGIAFLLAAVVAAVGYDVGGWVVGGRVGRHQLAPHISPNKTWEGLVGGMLICLLACAGVVTQIHPWTFHDAIALGLVAAVVAPIGDLCQSLIKRDLGIKDMGTILPGHGGILDRVDAILFVLPATYYLVRVLGLG